MTIHESATLVLTSARALFCNGQSTNEVVAAAERVGRKRGMSVELRARWGDLHLQIASDESRVLPSVAAVPAGLDMNRVVSATHIVDEFAAGRLTPTAANDALAAVSSSAPSPTWLFALAAGTAAVALAVIYGVHYVLSAVLIFFSAATCAVLRRWLARKSKNTLIQPFCAALLAGVIGAIAVKLEPTSSLRLMAI